MVLYETRIVNPLAIRFSQSRIRPKFQDGRGIEDSIPEIELVNLPPGMNSEYAGVLKHPFPEIEIIRWRPLERDDDGKAVVEDGNDTKVLGEEQWFSFDNRRLYCLQRAALKYWPQPVCVVVNSLRDMPGIRCAVRKFKTVSSGRRVDICHRWNNPRESDEKQIWDWMAHFNLNQNSLPSLSAIRSGLIRVLPALESILSDENKTWENLEDSSAVEQILSQNNKKSHIDLSKLFGAHKRNEDSETCAPSSPDVHPSQLYNAFPLPQAQLTTFPVSPSYADSSYSFPASPSMARVVPQSNCDGYPPPSPQQHLSPNEYSYYKLPQRAHFRAYPPSPLVEIIPQSPNSYAGVTMHPQDTRAPSGAFSCGSDNGYGSSDYGHSARRQSSLRASSEWSAGSSPESECFNGKMAGRQLLGLLKDGFDHEASSTASTCTGGARSGLNGTKLDLHSLFG